MALLSLVANYGSDDDSDSDDDGVIPTIPTTIIPQQSAGPQTKVAPDVELQSTTSKDRRSGLSFPSVHNDGEKESGGGSLFSALPQPKSKKEKKKKKKKKKKRKHDGDGKSKSKSKKKSKNSAPLAAEEETENSTNLEQQQSEIQQQNEEPQHRHAIFSMLPEPKNATKPTRLGSGSGKRLNLSSSSKNEPSSSNNGSSSSSSNSSSTTTTTTTTTSTMPTQIQSEPPKPKRRKFQSRLPSQSQMMGSFSIGSGVSNEHHEEEEEEVDDHGLHYGDTSSTKTQSSQNHRQHNPEVGPQRRGRHDTSYIDENDPSFAGHAMPDRSFVEGLQQNKRMISISGTDLQSGSQWKQNVDLNKEALAHSKISAPIYNPQAGHHELQNNFTGKTTRTNHITSLAVRYQKNRADYEARNANHYKHKDDASQRYGFGRR